MRNSTNTATTFAQWLAEQAPGATAPAMQGGSGAPQQPLFAPRLDEQSLADLATEILAMAIKLAVVLEASRQVSSARSRNTMRAPAAAAPSTSQQTGRLV